MKKQTIAQRLTLASDIPDAALPGVPIVEIAGANRVLIENHFGVAQYGTERVCVNVKFGQVCISGSGLELARMTKGHLVITGQIESICLLRGCR